MLTLTHRIVNDVSKIDPKGKTYQVLVVDVVGDLTLGEGCAEFKTGIASLPLQNGQKFVMNLLGINNVDSAGIGTLISAWVKLQEEKKVKFFGVIDFDSWLGKIFNLTGLGDSIRQFGAEGTAIADILYEILNGIE